MACADSATTSDLPADGLARTILSGDAGKHGRWESDSNLVDVEDAVPEPSSWAMMIVGFCSLEFIAYGRKNEAAHGTT
jgi:hypothetical protein